MTTGLFDGGALLVRARARSGTRACVVHLELRGPDHDTLAHGAVLVSSGASLNARDSAETDVDQVNRERFARFACTRSRLRRKRRVDAERVVSVNNGNYEAAGRHMREPTLESRMPIGGARFVAQAISNVYNVRLGTSATSSPGEATAHDAANDASVVTR